jgi:hypothetical protein
MNLEKYVYRLESPWSDWGQYFDARLQYTCVRTIDRVDEHGWDLTPVPGEDVCGLWCLSSFTDAVRFQDSEPLCWDEDSRSARLKAAVSKLAGRSGLSPIRFCVRIDRGAFGNGRLWPDLPLLSSYSSSCFHARVFDTQGSTWRIDEISSRRVPHVSVDDRHVEVYFDGRWYRKSREVGDAIRSLILRGRSAQGVVLDVAAEHAPAGTLGHLTSKILVPTGHGPAAGDSADSTADARVPPRWWSRLGQLVAAVKRKRS